MGKEKPIGAKMFQGILFAGLIIILLSKDATRETHAVAGLMGIFALSIEAYYYFKKE